MLHFLAFTLLGFPAVAITNLGAVRAACFRFRWRCTLTVWVVGCLAVTSAPAQSLVKTWDRTYGGVSLDQANATINTPDGGYLIGCTSISPISGERTQAGGGAQDYWVVKTDSTGRKEWDRALGGHDDEALNCLLATADGGYLLGGHTNTNYAPFGDISEPGRGEDDFWVVKLDARGTKLWDRRIGGRNDDYLYDMVPTADGGYLLVGLSNSPVSGDKTTPAYGNVVYGPTDCWLVKLDARGTVVWDRTVGGAQEDYANSVVPTPDGGFLVGGVSNSSAAGSKTAPLRGVADYWVLKIDASGAVQWQSTYGAPGATSGLATVVLAADGKNALLVGNSNGNRGGMKSEASRGGKDYWLVNIAVATGSVLWERTAGSSGEDVATAAVPTLGGGWLVAGAVGPGNGGECTATRRGGQDFWLLRLAPDGRIDDNFCVGGNDSDGPSTLMPAGDQWVIAGSSSSGISGDKSESLRGWADAWLVKLTLPAVVEEVLLCQGGQQLLSVPSGATAVQWSTGPTTATLTVTQPGTYTATYFLANGTTGTVRYSVRSFAPALALTGILRLCPGGNTLLSAVAPGATAYQWNTSATTRMLTVTQPGTYTVVATFISGCTRTAQVTVLREQANLPFTLGADTTLCTDEALVLRAPAWDGTGTYRWSDGSTGPTLRVDQAGTYTLQRANACETRSASRQVFYRSCVFIPNVITPYNDGVNDLFQAIRLPKGLWSLAIYSRWGAQVFQTDDYRHDWGKEASAGIYFYYLQQKDSNQRYRGWVEVIR